ncbi:MAG: hypothetical protein KBC05_00705 [Candidatus Hydrogenedentes bacterium]|nr:hypothetical protein [Candidatus Hydrogenedentota bacterium]
MKQIPDDSALRAFRLAEPAPELRARVLAAARQEWEKPAAASEWARLTNPLRALAASIAVAVVGHWANSRLAASPYAAVACVHEPLPRELTELAGRPSGFLFPVAPAADLSTRWVQLRDLLESPPPPPDLPARQGQTHDYRQKTSRPASYC